MKIYCEKNGFQHGCLWHPNILHQSPNDFIQWVKSPSEADFVLIHAQSKIFNYCDWDKHPNFIAWLPFDHPLPSHIERHWDNTKSNISLATTQQTVAPNRIGLHYLPWHSSFPEWQKLASYQSVRDLDVMCIHHATYSWPDVQQHREQATQAAMSLSPNLRSFVSSSKTPSERVQSQPFIEGMSKSKVCICADGFGPISSRDFQAIAFGCVLIKPETIHNPHDRRCYTWPDPVDMGQVVFCKSDFSDLSEKVDEALALFATTEDDRREKSEAFFNLKSTEFFERLHAALKGFM